MNTPDDIRPPALDELRRVPIYAQHLRLLEALCKRDKLTTDELLRAAFPLPSIAFEYTRLDEYQAMLAHEQITGTTTISPARVELMRQQHKAVGRYQRKQQGRAAWAALRHLERWGMVERVSSQVTLGNVPPGMRNAFAGAATCTWTITRFGRETLYLKQLYLKQLYHLQLQDPDGPALDLGNGEDLLVSADPDYLAKRKQAIHESLWRWKLARDRVLRDRRDARRRTREEQLHHPGGTKRSQRRRLAEAVQAVHIEVAQLAGRVHRRAQPCEQCGELEGVRMVPSMTAYAPTMDNPVPNQPSALCPDCAEDYVANWSSMWEDYYSSIMRAFHY